jgi:hypothetical protein
MAEDLQRLFADVREFGWNPKKRESNLRERDVDFEDVKVILDGYIYILRSDRYGEIRYQIFGYLQAREVAIICTLRGPCCWIISARRASKAERRRYYNRISVLTKDRED